MLLWKKFSELISGFLKLVKQTNKLTLLYSLDLNSVEGSEQVIGVGEEKGAIDNCERERSRGGWGWEGRGGERENQKKHPTTLPGKATLHIPMCHHNHAGLSAVVLSQVPLNGNRGRNTTVAPNTVWQFTLSSIKGESRTLLFHQMWCRLAQIYQAWGFLAK